MPSYYGNLLTYLLKFQLLPITSSKRLVRIVNVSPRSNLLTVPLEFLWKTNSLPVSGYNVGNLAPFFRYGRFRTSVVSNVGLKIFLMFLSPKVSK